IPRRAGCWVPECNGRCPVCVSRQPQYLKRFQPLRRCVPSNMRLNRLEIAGFKSFADRSELAFDTGVTAIVGPNGCGKSNVVDAITWVLGEQSARSLRGEKMEDVIFSGSDARKPTAAAEVRLKLSEVAQAAMAAATAATPVDVVA